MKIIFFFISFLLFGCAQQGEFLPPRQFSNTPKGNFDAFWNGVNQNYIFFEETKYNWNSIYVQYSDSVNSSTSKTKLFHLFNKMMSYLVDGHRVLTAQKDDRENFVGGQISAFDKNFTTKYPDFDVFNHSDNLIKHDTIFISKYLDGNFGVFNTFADENSEISPEMLYGIINNKILYVRMFVFGNALFLYKTKTELDRFYVKEFLTVLQNTSDAGAGLILDLRFNPGGNANEFYELGSIFVNKDYEWGFNQVRIGTGKNDLSSFMSEKFSKSKLDIYFKNKVVILTNKYSASASEILALSLKDLPNITILGDTTFGANGPISKIKEFTGNFTLPNNWEVQLAQRKTFDRNKINYEGVGISPDIIIKQDVAKAKTGIDNQLEAAISLF